MKNFPWIDLNQRMPEPEVFVLTWDGKRVGIDWWGSLRFRPAPDGGAPPTHWMPFPKPPGAGPMYGMHSLPDADRERLELGAALRTISGLY